MMVWSIFKDSDGDVKDYEAFAVLDGTYYVEFHWLGHFGRAYGVEVKDGEFVPGPTTKAIASAVEQAGYWGEFIESIYFDGEVFNVHVGS